MHILNLRRLLPARKAWRLFTTKLQTKLHNLHKSKTIKKPKYYPKTTTNSKRLFWTCLSLQSRFKRKRRTGTPHYQYRQKRASPVYIDHLFMDPLTKEKKVKVGTEKGAVAETAKVKVMVTADEMWESLALASPQMHGINERAQEFITKFRADMRLQESLARRL